MQSPDILLIDANAIGYAAMYQQGLAKLSKNGISTAALHGLPSSLFRIMRLFPRATPILMWDGHAAWRQEIYPEYKINRNLDPETVQLKEAYKAQGPYLRQLILKLGIPQIADPEAETDDIAGLIVRNAPGDLNILMVTTDMDWVQALQKNVSIFNPRTDTHIDLALISTDQFKDGPFSCPEQYLTAKCLAGDTSDFISGIDGIGLKTGAKIIETHGGLEALWARADSGEVFKGKRVQAIISELGREIYWRNRKLMDWRQALLPDNVRVYGTRPDEAAFRSIASEFDLVDVLSHGSSLMSRANRLGWYDQWHTHGRLIRQIMIDRRADRATESIIERNRCANI